MKRYIPPGSKLTPGPVSKVKKKVEDKWKAINIFLKIIVRYIYIEICDYTTTYYLHYLPTSYRGKIASSNDALFATVL